MPVNHSPRSVFQSKPKRARSEIPPTPINTDNYALARGVGAYEREHGQDGPNAEARFPVPRITGKVKSRGSVSEEVSELCPCSAAGCLHNVIYRQESSQGKFSHEVLRSREKPNYNFCIPGCRRKNRCYVALNGLIHAKSSSRACAASQRSTARWAFSQELRRIPRHARIGEPSPGLSPLSQQLVDRLARDAHRIGQTGNRETIIVQHKVFTQHFARVGWGAASFSLCLEVAILSLVSVVVAYFDVIGYLKNGGGKARKDNRWGEHGNAFLAKFNSQGGENGSSGGWSR